MEKEHIYKFLLYVGIILYIASLVIFALIFSSIVDRATVLLNLAFFGIFYIFAIPLFIISITLIIISSIKLINKNNKK